MKWERLIALLTIVLIIVSWFLITKFKLVSEILIPSPVMVFSSFKETIVSGYKGFSLGTHFADSMFRLLSAFSLAIITGVPLGLLSGYNSKVRAALDTIIEFYRPIPPLAYFTILIIWLGIGDGSKIALLYLAALAPIYVACIAGVKSIRSDYIKGAQTLGAGKIQIFWHVILPASLPYIFTGLRTSIGAAYSTLVAAEMVASETGIGWMVLDASRFLRSDIIFMGILIMGVTGILLDKIIQFAEKQIVPWKGKN